MKIVLAVAALAALAALVAATASGARAAPIAPGVTVDTFRFTEGGFSGPISPGSTGVLSGTFTGTVEANGTIQRADLTSISVSYAVGATSLFGYGPATFFSFVPGFDSSLDFATVIGVNGFACVGAVSAFGADGCGAGDVNGEVAGLDTTQSLPVLTLISSVTRDPGGLPPGMRPLPPRPIPPTGPNMPPYPQPVPAPGGSVMAVAALFVWRAVRRTAAV